MITEEQFIAAYEQHSRNTLGFLKNRLRSRPQAEDVNQAGWLLAWKKREQFRGDSSIATWVYKILWNLTCNEHRNKHYNMIQFTLDWHGGVREDPTETQILCQQILALLPKSQRKLLERHYLDGACYKSNAEKLRTNRARQHARSMAA
jgi:RNA polymerase sigma-70 factor, ECF subfamily